MKTIEKKHWMLGILIVVVMLVQACSTSNEELIKEEMAPESSYQEDLVAKGWRLVNRWDFYNELEGWNHDTITVKDSGGYIQIEDGVLEFGYSKNGGRLYFKNSLTVVPNYSYMLISRIKTENPYRALLGFYDPDDNKLNGGVKIRQDDWHILKVVLSIDPTTGQTIPTELYPSIENLTRQDYTYVDWVEFWIYPKQKK